jgi:hypothetical protein
MEITLTVSIDTDESQSDYVLDQAIRTHIHTQSASHIREYGVRKYWDGGASITWKVRKD